VQQDRGSANEREADGIGDVPDAGPKTLEIYWRDAMTPA
jgi:hypothetical protein